jgi:hypothetical protein
VSMAGRKAGVFCAKRCFEQRTMVMSTMKDTNKLSACLSLTKSTGGSDLSCVQTMYWFFEDLSGGALCTLRVIYNCAWANSNFACARNTGSSKKYPEYAAKPVLEVKLFPVMSFSKEMFMRKQEVWYLAHKYRTASWIASIVHRCGALGSRTKKD